MPRLVGWARLHGRKYMDKARMIPPFHDYLLDTLLFAEVLAADEFNIQAMFLGQSISINTHLFPKRLSPLGVIENPDTAGIQKCGHPPA